MDEICRDWDNATVSLEQNVWSITETVAPSQGARCLLTGCMQGWQKEYLQAASCTAYADFVCICLGSFWNSRFALIYRIYAP